MTEQNGGDRIDTQNKMAEWVALIEKVVTCDQGTEDERCQKKKSTDGE